MGKALKRGSFLSPDQKVEFHRLVTKLEDMGFGKAEIAEAAGYTADNSLYSAYNRAKMHNGEPAPAVTLDRLKSLREFVGQKEGKKDKPNNEPKALLSEREQEEFRSKCQDLADIGMSDREVSEALGYSHPSNYRRARDSGRSDHKRLDSLRTLHRKEVLLQNDNEPIAEPSSFVGMARLEDMHEEAVRHGEEAIDILRGIIDSLPAPAGAGYRPALEKIESGVKALIEPAAEPGGDFASDL